MAFSSTFLFFQVISVCVHSYVTADLAGNLCQDALKRSTNLCSLWKRSELCDDANVRSFCKRSCDLCSEEKDEPSYQYVGCFKDHLTSELRVRSLDEPLTVRSCSRACSLNDYKYAGLRNGKHCLCGNDYGSHGEVTKRSGCSKTCGSAHPCGDFMQNSIYHAEPTKMKKRHYLDDIEELILGKTKKEMLDKRNHSPSHRRVKLVMPKTRSWDFASWIKKYEDQKDRFN